MEQTNLYGTFDKGTNSFVNYFNAVSDVAATRYVKSNLKAMELDNKLPDEDMLDCLALYKIAEISSDKLADIIESTPLVSYNELLGKVKN